MPISFFYSFIFYNDVSFPGRIYIGLKFLMQEVSLRTSGTPWFKRFSNQSVENMVARGDAEFPIT